ncbi:MAG TPA: sugar ABC transporter permease [Chloroflexota bacterium]|nr:sugar ABC transporter permease [Chloroflexota bacterium]
MSTSPVSSLVEMTSRRRSRRRRVNRVMLGYALIAPAVLWRASISVYPFGRAVLQSFTNESPLNAAVHWVGWRNYFNMFQDTTVTQSLLFTLIFTLAGSALQLVYALGIASLLNRSFRGRTLVRAVNLLPWAMPTIVIATAAQWFFNDQYGMIDDLIARIVPVRPVWLASPTGARVAVVLLDVWKNAPWAAIFVLAGLQTIPSELYEAARVDGASPWCTYRTVVLPLLAPLLITLTVFIATYRVLSFDIVYGFTQGGPGYTTSLLSYQVYKLAFTGLEYGYGSAVAVFTFLVVLCITLVCFGFLRRSVNYL